MRESEHSNDSYRPNVCSVILHQDGSQVLFCHRVGFRIDEGWQFPQGGYNPQLDLIQEMKRELREEITTDAVEVIRISKREYSYDFPNRANNRGGYIGQRQVWVLCQLVGNENAISVHTELPEFDQWIWVAPEDAINKVVGFKREIYRNALIELGVLSQ